MNFLILTPTGTISCLWCKGVTAVAEALQKIPVFYHCKVKNRSIVTFIPLDHLETILFNAYKEISELELGNLVQSWCESYTLKQVISNLQGFKA